MYLQGFIFLYKNLTFIICIRVYVYVYLLHNNKLKVMKTYKFTIWFEDGTGLEEYAFNMREAAILAMAKRIKDAKNFYIDCIENEKGESFEVSNFIEFSKIQNK